VRGKGAVGGLEEMMAFVEDVAGRQLPVVAAAHGGLDHHQGMVGDHDVGLARGAHRALDEALLVVLAGGVDALAAPVGEAEGAQGAEEVDKPAGKVAADHVAAPRARGPARHQAEGHGVLRARRHLRHGLGQVQQAEIVLAALADHHLAGALARLGKEARELVVDLALQVAGIGGDPDGGLVALRPERGRRQVAQGLAGARAGLGQDHLRLVLPGAGGEGGSRRGGVVGLLRPRLGLLVEKLAQACAGLVL